MKARRRRLALLMVAWGLALPAVPAEAKPTGGVAPRPCSSLWPAGSKVR
jgi:hypothetical protein